MKPMTGTLHVLQICLLILALTTIAPPAAAAKSVLQLYREAEVHFSMARFKRSVRLLERARRRAKDPQLLAKIHLLMGVNLGVLKRTDRARRRFEEALKLDPNVTLDNRAVKPPIIALFDEARERVTGDLQITDYPAGSLVLVNGEEAGKVPLLLTLPVGEHQIEVRTPDGSRRGETTLTIAFGKTQSVEVQLEQVASVAPAPRPSPRPTPRRRVEATPRWRLYSGIAALGVGAGLVANGIVFGVKVANANDDYAAGRDTLPYAQLKAIEDDAQRYETIQLATLIAGGAVMAAGGGLLLWHFLHDTPGQSPSTALTPMFGPTGLGISCTTRF
jgi:hypothetical protein